ncbi:MAG: histidine--tRNA ligase [Lachnospiraceae bacterium]|nr:histidine--tRNA ligase [Lachnospiraceae bacterium]
MALVKKPVTGMKEIMPREMEIRAYVQGIIRETYSSFGFTPIETPCLEDINNLCSKQGGENEKLIFKVLKRGEKLNLETAKSEADLTDMGLRYDLTVPLVRFYSNNANDLPVPFKALQMGNVWRADRPQRGRYRQFMQCDIDIFGESSNMAEIELILATTTTLGKIGFKNFEIRINDRRLLKAMSDYAGFDPDKFDNVCIILDKLDKIGLDGVKAELVSEGFEAASVDKYCALFDGTEGSLEGLSKIRATLGDSLDEAVSTNLSEIISSVESVKEADFKMVFDPTLVRGMGYYTGTIFEIAIPEFGGSCGGGGRYDKMVGNFTGTDVPACGFSIGFERIVLLLLESNFRIPGKGEKAAYLVDKDMPKELFAKILKEAMEERKAGKTVLVSKMNKNKKFQKEKLSAEGYTEFKEFYADSYKG